MTTSVGPSWITQDFYELKLFSRLTRDEINQLASIAVPLNFKKGELLFEEGTPGTALYILWQGDIEIRKADRLITTLTAKTVCGEMSLLSGGERSCSGLALSDLEVYKVKRDHFLDLLDQGSIAAYKVIYNLSQELANRLRKMNDKVVQLPDGSSTKEFANLKDKLLKEWAF